MPSPLRLTRPALLTPDALGRVHEAAVRLLDQVGMRVLSTEGREAARRLGLRAAGERVFFTRAQVDAFVASARQPETGEEGEAPSPSITLGVCQYAHHVHDLVTDEIVPFTSARLIEMTKLVDTLRPLGVVARAPGMPSDVPPDLQGLQKYRIQANYSRDGRRPVEIESPRAMPFLLDMAEALGHPITSAAVYIVSPLTLGGSSLEYALVGRDRLRSLWVSNMSSLGATAPIGVGDALALGVAEVVGGAILAREATGLPVDWSIRVCPFDPRPMAMTLGGPEEILLQWAFEEVNAWYHGRKPSAPNGTLHSQAKRPGAQSMAERMEMMVSCALLGTRSFAGLGRLSLDEIFSPAQAVLDLEMRDQVQQLITGLDVDCDPEACVTEVAAGLADGFLSLDSTAAQYATRYWRPRLFHRGLLQEWQTAGAPDLRTRANEMVRQQIRQHEFELEEGLHREVERIYAAAERGWCRGTS